MQEFALNVGVGMIDATICDIYLVDDADNLVGRPVLTIVTDAYSNGFVREFQLSQDSVKSFLIDHGYVDKDAGERLARDYRKNACLTMEDYEKVIIHAILYSNNHRIVGNYPYTEEMIEAKVQPYLSSIFKWGKEQPGCNLITVSKKELVMTLLPRTDAWFARQGLIVFGLRCDSKERN